ncbi:MAG: hypothetical protein ACMXYD_01045 [Candidatus Woesearchaeota archaeon]
MGTGDIVIANPNLDITLDFILADNTPLFVDKGVTQTHGGSYLKHFKTATSSPFTLKKYFPVVHNRLSSWIDMFSRDDVLTVGGVLSELYDEQLLLDKLYKEMRGYVNFISESPIKSSQEKRNEKEALKEFKKLKDLRKRGVELSKSKIYREPRRSLDETYRATRKQAIALWKNSSLYRKPREGKKPSYADQKLVGATLFVSSQNNKVALLTADFGIRKYYDHLYINRPSLWTSSVRAPIELFCFKADNPGEDKTFLEITTYFPKQIARTELPVEAMRLSGEVLSQTYRQTG